MKLIKELKETRKNKSLYTVVAFYLAIFIVAFILGKTFSALASSYKTNPLFFAILISIIYLLILVFCYSFFKLGIINAVEKKKISRKAFESLGSFFKFNIVSLVLALIVFLVAGAVITYSLNSSAVAGAVFIAIFLIFYYPFLSFSQFEFIQNKKIFKSMGIAWKKLFSHRIKDYLKLLLLNVIVIVAYFLIFYLIGSLYKIIFINNNTNSAMYVSSYNVVFNVLLAIVALILVSVNIFILKRIRD